jgi:serine/threonine protein kinase/Tol biopolymer transport system component
MAIASGTRFNHYEILSRLGAGGMGEVYRARDIRLDREVAIKVLPPDVAKEADRLRRFEQEARAASALNHPNILTLYDIGAHDGAPYIVSELLEGCELREHLNDGPLPVRRAIDYALQITAGLAVAHDKGIVHRDLKPENLFVTNDGRVKILDFGLAKLKPKLGPSIDSEAQTMKPLTHPGMVMGTAGYMSPEQVRGLEVDQRSDIFSFGLILYEMLAGERAFIGLTVADLMTAILKEEPLEFSATNEQVSPALDRIMRRCLEKKPEQRFHSAHDLGLALEVVATPNTSASVQTNLAPALQTADTPKRGGWRDYLGWIVAGICVLIAALALGIPWFNRAPPAAQAVRFKILPPDMTSFAEISFALSPDGRMLVFCAADSNGKRMLYLRPLNSFSAQPLLGTEGAAAPFWSPDSRSIAFYSEKKLKRVEVSGGSPQMVCAAENAGGGSWNRAGDIIIAPTGGGVLYRVPANGGAPITLTTLDQSRGEESHWLPQFLPDGDHFLYYASCRQTGQSGIYVSALSDNTTRPVLNTDFSAVYAAGHLLFVKNGALMGQSFDDRAVKLSGEPFLIAEQVRTFFIVPHLSVAENGTLAYQSGGTQTPQLVWFDRHGKQIGTVGEAADYSNPSLAPDEKRIAVCIRDAKTKVRDIWLFDLMRGAKSRFTFDPAEDLNPTWSTDGSRIFFSSSRKGPRDLYQKRVDAADDEEIIYASSDIKNVEAISPDGRFLLYNTNPGSNDHSTKNDLWFMPMDGERIPKPYLKTQFNEDQADISPDGRWIAYRSDESGREEIYVATFPQIGGKWQISSGGGDEPRWRRDGKELFFTVGDRKVMSAEVKTNSAAFETSVPTILFETQLGNLGRNRYVVTGDGRRFLVSARLDDPALPINIVLNWTAELKK